MKDDDGERGLREDRDVDLSLACVTSVLRSAFSLPVGRHDFPQHARRLGTIDINKIRVIASVRVKSPVGSNLLAFSIRQEKRRF